MKRRIRLTEGILRRIVRKTVGAVLREGEERTLRVRYDGELSRSIGREYYYCADNGRYYINVDGRWLICTDNYYLEPICQVDDDVNVVVESRRGAKNGFRNVLSESFVEDSCLMLEPGRYGEFRVTDTNHPSFSWDAEMFVENGRVWCVLTSIGDDARAKKMADSTILQSKCIDIALSEYPSHIGGLNMHYETYAEEDGMDFDEVVEDLRASSVKVGGYSYDKYSRDMADNMRLSNGADDFSHDVMMSTRRR